MKGRKSNSWNDYSSAFIISLGMLSGLDALPLANLLRFSTKIFLLNHVLFYDQAFLFLYFFLFCSMWPLVWSMGILLYGACVIGGLVYWVVTTWACL